MSASSALAPNAIEATTIRKLRTHIIPFVFVLFVIAYIDRINIGFAALSGRQVERGLFVAQGDHRFHSRGMAGGDEACCERDQAKQNGDGRKRKGIGRVDPYEEALHRAGKCPCCTETHAYA